MRSMRYLTLTLLLVAAAGCTGRADGGHEPLRVGTSLPLTGERAQLGLATRSGYQVWQDMVNTGGGPLGSFSSLLNLPASAVAERGRMLFVCPSCGSPEIFKRGLHHLFFAQPATGVHQADLFAQWVASLPPDPRPRTAAYPMLDDPFARPVIEGIRRQLEAIGVKTVHREVYPQDTRGFLTIAGRTGATGADLVAHGAAFEDGVALVKAFVKVGYHPKVLFQTTAPTEGEEFLSELGQRNADGVFFAVSWSPAANYPGNQDFVRACQRRFGGTPSEDAADAFAAAQTVQAAVGAVGSLDQAKLAGWLHANTVQTILGPMSWDERGAPEGSFILGQWQRGSSRIVLPRNVADTDTIVFPKPAWAPAGY